MSLRGTCYSPRSSGCHPHEKCDYNGLSNIAEQQQMLVNSCIVILILYLKSSRAVAQCAVYWTGPSCHRGTVPKIEMLLSPGPAVSGLCAGRCCCAGRHPQHSCLGLPSASLQTLLSWQGWSLLNSSYSSRVWQQIFSTVLLITSIRQIALVCHQKIFFLVVELEHFLPKFSSSGFQHSILPELEKSWAGCNWHFTLGYSK